MINEILPTYYIFFHVILYIKGLGTDYMTSVFILWRIVIIIYSIILQYKDGRITYNVNKRQKFIFLSFCIIYNTHILYVYVCNIYYNNIYDDRRIENFTSNSGKYTKITNVYIIILLLFYYLYRKLNKYNIDKNMQ